VCFARPIKFINGLTGEQKDTAWMPIVIVYVGRRHEEFQHEFSQFGLVTRPLPKLTSQRPVKRIGLIKRIVINEHFLPLN